MSIEFILDGRTVSAEPGQTILEVAKANGIEIPTLCREQRISRTTSCFVCVVKDKKTGRFLPSCSACPAQGQRSTPPATRCSTCAAPRSICC